MNDRALLSARVAARNDGLPLMQFPTAESVNPSDAADDLCQPESTQPLSDEGREEAITRAGNAMQREYAAYQAADARRDLNAATTHLNRAYRHLEQQRVLIAGRSQIARMEAERGLA